MGKGSGRAGPSGGEEKPAAFGKVLRRFGPRLLKQMNEVSHLALGDGRLLVSLDRRYLVDKACQMTGLDDFGAPILEPLGILLRSFEEDANLNLIGRITVQSEMLRVLCNRLRLQKDRKQYPAIADENIRRPLFITGLPRSGTTFLHALLSRDPACRAPQVWEVMHPSPPPESATYQADPRVDRTRKELRWIDILMPDFRKCHTIDATLPQECIAITDHSFLSYLFESMYYVTSYRKWHDAQDKRRAYAYHRCFLQHLQWRCPGEQWVLKAPSHLMALNSLFEVYPDAQIVMTHRDPLKVLPSCASFAKVLRAPFTGAIDLKELGAEVSRRWTDSARLVTKMRAERKELGERFFDVGYPDLVRDPMETVRGIYRHWDRNLSPQAEEAMLRFVSSHPKDQGGVHLYSLEEFGLDPVAERRNFREYQEYFQVVPEP